MIIKAFLLLLFCFLALGAFDMGTSVRGLSSKELEKFEPSYLWWCQRWYLIVVALIVIGIAIA